MSLAAKPKRSDAPAQSDSAAVARFVEDGGSVAKSKPGSPIRHPLKFPAGSELFQRLERARTKGDVPLPRNTWILQAISEKLERES